MPIIVFIGARCPGGVSHDLSGHVTQCLHGHSCWSRELADTSLFDYTHRQ